MNATASRAARWFFGVLASLPLAHGAIWPEQWWEYKRLSVTPVKVSDQAVWEEYGLDEALTAQYDDGKVQFKATGYRLRDTTAAMAVFQWLRPAGWRTSDISDLAATNGPDTLFTKGNYVLLLQGHMPDAEKRDILYVQLARMELSALPPLATYLPKDGLIDGTSRFVTGPASLEKFEPRIPPSLAAFHVGAEGQLGRYRGDTSLAIFNYPTPAIARDIAAKFQQIPGALAKRSGPLVAITFGPDADAAERLLAKINYKATVSWNEPLNAPEQNPGEMLVSIFQLIGVLVGGIAGCGLLIAATKIVGRRYLGWNQPGTAMVTLGIDTEERR
jgi:hypothetical protein